MSADNYAVVRKIGNKWWWAIGFASDGPGRLPDTKFQHGPYATEDDVSNALEDEYLEYGLWPDEEEPEPKSLSEEDRAAIYSILCAVATTGLSSNRDLYARLDDVEAIVCNSETSLQ